MMVAWGFSRGLGQVLTSRRFQGTLLIQPHTAEAEHSPAGEAPRPTGAGAHLPLPCPPPGEGHTVALACHARWWGPI
jgi:hypothetical protein